MNSPNMLIQLERIDEFVNSNMPTELVTMVVYLFYFFSHSHHIMCNVSMLIYIRLQYINAG